MPRPTITCPSCHRKLYHLHTPHCSWCGADLPEEQFEQAALPPGDMPVTDLPPLLPETPPTGFYQGNFGWGLFNQQPAYQQQKYQLNLNITQIVLIVCLLLTPLAYFFWGNRLHPVGPPSHQARDMPPRSLGNQFGR